MFEIFIKQCSELTNEENAQVKETDHLAFSTPDSGLAVEDINQIEWSDPSWYILGRLEGRIVSIVGVLYREIRVGEQTVPVAGIGGVATHPAFQQRGLAGQLMQQAAIFMNDELRVPFGLLVCSDRRIPYYGKFGWQLVKSPMQFDCRGKKEMFHENTMVLPLGEKLWPEGPIDLCGKPW